MCGERYKKMICHRVMATLSNEVELFQTSSFLFLYNSVLRVFFFSPNHNNYNKTSNEIIISLHKSITATACNYLITVALNLGYSRYCSLFVEIINKGQVSRIIMLLSRHETRHTLLQTYLLTLTWLGNFQKQFFFEITNQTTLQFIIS